MGDQALVDLDHLVRAMAAQASDPVPVNGKGDDGTPGQAALVTVDGLNLDLPVEPGDAAELLADHRRLELPLGRQARVLPVAAAAAARCGVTARRRHPVG